LAGLACRLDCATACAPRVTAITAAGVNVETPAGAAARALALRA
jgi:hypothetical protein